MSVEEAPQEAEVILLAVPWVAALDSVRSIGNLHHKILIDATNPIMMSSQGLQEGLVLGHTTSAAEQISETVINARVVKAFNQAGAGVMANPNVKSHDCTLFICGDDDEAKQVVKRLAEAMSLHVFDVGALRQARLLEPLGMLWIHMCYLQGKGSDFCFKVTDLAPA